MAVALKESAATASRRNPASSIGFRATPRTALASESDPFARSW